MLALLLLASVWGADFQVTAPPQWQEILPATGFREFRNVRSKIEERVVLFAQGGRGGPVERAALEEVRRDVFEAAGIRNYAVLSVERRGACEEIRASYYTTKPMQILERRCAGDKRQTHVFYLREGVALNEIGRARAVLENFKPVARREPASEIVGTASPDPVRLQSDEAAQRRFCERVPAHRRRDFFGTTTGKVEAALDATVLAQNHCLRGAILDNVWDLLKSTAEYNWALLKYRFNPAYRTEVNAAVSLVASEVRRDPSGFMAKIGSQIAKVTVDSGVEFMSCLKPAEQIRVFCKIAANLIPAGLLAKLGSKAPLAANEALDVAKIVREAIALERNVPEAPALYPKLGSIPEPVVTAPAAVTEPMPRPLAPLIPRDAPTPAVTEQIPRPASDDVPAVTERVARPQSAPRDVAADSELVYPPLRPDRNKLAAEKYSPAIEKLAPTRNGTYFDHPPPTEKWRQWSPTDVDGLPTQGWKLHVSAQPDRAASIAEALLPELRRRGIGHKVINDLEYYRKLKPTSTQSGKFITLYVHSDKEAREVATLVDKLLRERGFKSGDYSKPPTEHQFYPGVTGRYGLNKLQDNFREVDGVMTNEWIQLPGGRIVRDNRSIPFPAGVDIP